MRDERKKFDETVAILVKAYLDDTLLHGDCVACAVGNIVAAKKNLAIIRDPEHGDLVWSNLQRPVWFDIMVMGKVYERRLIDDNMYEQSMREINYTGYTAEELARIEFAFETADADPEADFFAPDNDPIWMFNGLMAVVDVLAEIHGIDLTTKEESKKLFVKA
jgi:hypothetical protein